jgi:hypothetical protein
MSMSTSKDISHIVKFDGSNFQQWKFGCRLLLESFNLLDIVDGVEKIPAAVSFLFTSKLFQLLMHLLIGFQSKVD